MAAPAPTSRSRAPPAGDEEASTVLKLGEFQDVDALTHSEAALVINALVAKRRGDRKNVNETEILSSLCCDTADEAKTLIPSLQDKISDDDLTELLDEITKLMGFTN
ncbi:uncharacterized protein EAF02_011823 [Botrytis sinoallii]|uniref:uncharacterized protein n=1 Tax=Botrytis sinoallii TaxID=1463999 RepID=UPI001901F2C6|nr:uncharacterized protein EAF02_011823 [Botrytis sinoallii]KAF7853833.1 hypothetical protein EAF02_011823 [Botrytis sinoallii]